MKKLQKSIILIMILMVLGNLSVCLAVTNSSTGGDKPISVEKEKEKEGILKNPLKYDTLEELFNAVVGFIFNMALLVAPIIVIIGGFLIITGTGDPSKVEKGRKMIISAIIGFVIIFASQGLVVVVRRVIEGSPDPGSFQPTADPLSYIGRLQNPAHYNTLEELFNAVVGFIFNMALLIAPIMIIVGGFQIVTAVGNPSKIEKGKKIIVGALIGFTIVLVSRGVVEIVKGFIR